MAPSGIPPGRTEPGSSRRSSSQWPASGRWPATAAARSSGRPASARQRTRLGGGQRVEPPVPGPAARRRTMLPITRTRDMPPSGNASSRTPVTGRRWRRPGARAGCRAAAGCARAAAASPGTPAGGAASPAASGGLAPRPRPSVVLEVRGVDDQLPDLPGEGQPEHGVSPARRRAAAGSPIPRPWTWPCPAGSAGRPRCRSRRCWPRPRRRTAGWPGRWSARPARAGPGTTWPRTRSLATPPSGKIDSRTWVNRRGSVTPNVLCASPRSGMRGTISVQSGRDQPARPGSGSPPRRTPRPGRTRDGSR